MQRFSACQFLVISLTVSFKQQIFDLIGVEFINFSFMDCVFGVLIKKCFTKITKIFSYIHCQNFYSFEVNICLDPFCYFLYIEWDMDPSTRYCTIHLCVCVYVSAQFIEKGNSSPFSCLCTFVENQSLIHMWVYFGLYFVPLMYL